MEVHVVVSILLAACYVLGMAMAKTGPQHGKVVTCYISSWAVYRPGQGAYSLDNFDPSLCTHVVYAFAGLDISQSAIKSLDPWQDLKDNFGKGGYERLTGMKRSYPHLKVSLAIGGWNEGSTNYSILVSDPKKRGHFVKQVTEFVRKYNFDGLDLDWEYPTQRGGDPSDRENFVHLTRELRHEFDQHNLLLTSAIGAAKNIIDTGYDIPQLSKYLDYLHIMCYDYHGSWDKTVGYNAPLKSSINDDVLSVEFTIEYLLKLGAPPSKVVLGVPFYGRTFKTPLSPGELGDGTDGSTGFQGPFTREDGFLGYNEICRLLSNKTAGWSTLWDAKASQMLARSERDRDGMTRVVTYDNARAVANKVRYALRRKLAGVMIWSIDTDDFLGKCPLDEDTYEDFILPSDKEQNLFQKRPSTNYPLLRTINEAIALVLETDHEQAIVPKDEDNEIPRDPIEDRKISNSNSTSSINAPASVLTWSALILMFILYTQGYF